MKPGEDNSEPVSIDISKLLDSSKMWVFISLDEKGLHFHSSSNEEGIVLMSLTLSSNEDILKNSKRYTDQLLLKKKN